ncbi:MAG: flagellar hook-length control protein FliK [Bryobacteraceae bacterium]|nr:flagellar hook-length control protein FliK [Bryobacteraceae bacterium]
MAAEERPPWNQERQPTLQLSEDPREAKRETQVEAPFPAILPAYPLELPVPLKSPEPPGSAGFAEDRTKQPVLHGSAREPIFLSAALTRGISPRRQPPEPELGFVREGQRNTGEAQRINRSVDSGPQPVLARDIADEREPELESFRLILSARSVAPDRSPATPHSIRLAGPSAPPESVPGREDAAADRVLETQYSFQEKVSAPVFAPAESRNLPTDRETTTKETAPPVADPVEAPAIEDAKPKARAEFGLRWPQAGGVSVELIDRNGTVDVTVRAADPELRSHLEVHLPELVGSLESAGFEVTPYAAEAQLREPDLTELRASDTRDPAARRDPPGTSPDADARERRNRRNRRPMGIAGSERRLSDSGFEPAHISGLREKGLM